MAMAELARFDQNPWSDDETSPKGGPSPARVEDLVRRRARAGGEPQPIDLAGLDSDFEQLAIRLEADCGILWCYQQHGAVPCFSPELLHQVLDLQTRLQRALSGVGRERLPLRYLVWASSTPGIYNLGGDLRLFTKLIRARDQEGLFRYAKACVDICYLNSVSLDLPIMTVALVQGDALGGGFEAVLSNDLVIAEQRSQFGLPEVLFNMFPGMGAYSFLSRRIGPARAREMILSGKLYAAEELHEMGLVDLIVPTGHGEAAMREYLDRKSARHAVHTALARVGRYCQPISYEELIGVTDIWVETALGLSESDLHRMERLAAAQERRQTRATAPVRPADASDAVSAAG